MSDGQHADNENERTVLEGILYFIGILLRYKWYIVIITVIAMVASVVFSIITLMLPTDINPMPNTYRSRAVIRVEGNTSTLSMDSLLASFGFEDDVDQNADTRIVIQYVLNSGTFIDQIVEEFDIIKMMNITEKVRANSRNFIRSFSSNWYDRDSGLMYIAFEYTDPVFVRDIVNRKVELLQDWFLERGGTVRTRQMELLEKRMNETQAKINELETYIKNFQNKYGVLSVEALAEQLETIKSDLQSQLVQVDMEIREYSQYSRIEDPSLSRLKAKRQNILSMLSELESGYSIGGKKMPSREELAELSINFTRLSMDLQIQQDIYQTLSQRYEALRLAAIEESLFTVLEWGEIPEEKTGPFRGRICMIATIAAFFLSALGVLIFHYLKGVFMDPEKIKLLKYDKGSKGEE